MKRYVIHGRMIFQDNRTESPEIGDALGSFHRLFRTRVDFRRLMHLLPDGNCFFDITCTTMKSSGLMACMHHIVLLNKETGRTS